MSEARSWIDFDHSELSVREQCRILGLHRSSVYYDPVPESEENLRLMRMMDEEHLKRPNRGSRQMVDFLASQGVQRHLKENEVPHIWNVDGHGHDATHWRNNLYYFAQRIFQSTTK